MGNALSLAVSIAVPLVGGMIGGLVTQKDVMDWYPTIKKPKWTPPNFLFPTVWTALYAMMGTASWLVWKKKGKNTTALVLYGAQLVLNLVWNPLFFKTHKTDLALLDITALLGVATAATVFMSRAGNPAVQLPLMVPYLLWVSYATALNANIYLNNPSERLFTSRKQRDREIKAGKDAVKPGSMMAEAAKAAVTGVEAAKAASEAVSAGSAAIKHASAAAKPVAAAAAKVKHIAEGISHAAKDVGAALGEAESETALPPAEFADTTPATMAPASRAMAEEVQRATAATGSAPGAI